MAMFNPKRIPKWAWYTSAGVGIVGIVLMLRRQKSSPDPSQSASDQAGVTGYTDPMQNMPGIVVAPSSPPDLSQLQLPDQPDIGSILGGVAELIGTLYPGGLGGSVPVGGGGGAPSTGGAGSTGGVVTVPNPNPGPAKPNPCVGMDAGGSAGACKPAGAICRHMIGCGSNSEGHYCTWKFKFADGHSNCFNNYSSGKKAGQCVGPFGCP